MLKDKRILLIDPDPAIHNHLEQALRKNGATPCTVRNAEDALTLLSQEHIDVLLVELRLPGMNAYDFCRALSQVPRLAAIPVVATSPNPFVNSINIATCPNVVDFVRKPFRIEELLVALRRALSGEQSFIARAMRRA